MARTSAATPVTHPGRRQLRPFPVSVPGRKKDAFLCIFLDCFRTYTQTHFLHDPREQTLPQSYETKPVSGVGFRAEGSIEFGV